jgi:hypothetical protein
MPGESRKSTTHHLLVVIHVALAALAVALIFLAELRTGPVRETFKALFMVECGALLYRALRSGRARQSPDASIEHLMNGGVAPITTTIERIAFLTAVVAIAVMALS